MTKSILTAVILAFFSAVPAAAQFGGAAGIGEGEALFARAQSDREPGAVYVYRDTGDGWSQVARAVSRRRRDRGRVRFFVNVSSDVMVVGAPGAEEARGACTRSSAAATERGARPRSWWRPIGSG